MNNKKKKGNKPSRGSKSRSSQREYSGDNRSRFVPRNSKIPEDQFTKDGVSEGANDLSWYNRYPNLLDAASRVSTAVYPGMDVGFPFSQDNSAVIPGVMSISFLPSIGISADNNSPASQLSLELYARVRAAYSGELVADGPDMTVYVLCMANIYMYISWLKRIYRTLNSFSPVNKATPNALLTAYGLNDSQIKELRQHKVELWSYINQLIAQTRVLKVPAVFDVMRRYVWLCDNVFMDTDDISQAQLYCFNPVGFYKYNPQNTPAGVSASGASILVNPAMVVPTAYASMDTAKMLFSVGEELLSALKDWSTSYTINGYFQRAFGTDQFFGYEELMESDLQVPFYNEEVLVEIENVMTVSTALGVFAGNLAAYDFTGLSISQDPTTNSILSSNVISLLNLPQKTPVINQKAFINLRGEYRPEKVVIASRMQSVVKGVKETANGSNFNYAITIDSGTEIALGISIVLKPNAYTGAGSIPGTPIIQRMIINGATIQNVGGIESYLYVEAFDWHPFIFVTFNTGKVSIMGDIHTYNTYQLQDLIRLHEVCMYSEYNAFSLV